MPKLVCDICNKEIKDDENYKNYSKSMLKNLLTSGTPCHLHCIKKHQKWMWIALGIITLIMIIGIVVIFSIILTM